MRFYSESDDYDINDAREQCDHNFNPINDRFLNPFDSGMRCTYCGLVVDEEDPILDADEEEEEDVLDDFDDEVEDEED